MLPREPVDRVLARHVPALNGYQAAALNGRRTPLATLVAHVAYGTIVGGFISLAS